MRSPLRASPLARRSEGTAHISSYTPICTHARAHAHGLHNVTSSTVSGPARNTHATRSACVHTPPSHPNAYEPTTPTATHSLRPPLSYPSLRSCACHTTPCAHAAVYDAYMLQVSVQAQLRDIFGNASASGVVGAMVTSALIASLEGPDGTGGRLRKKLAVHALSNLGVYEATTTPELRGTMLSRTPICICIHGRVRGHICMFGASTRERHVHSMCILLLHVMSSTPPLSFATPPPLPLPTPGEYELHVTLHGAPVDNSPVCFVILPDKPSGAKSRIVSTAHTPPVICPSPLAPLPRRTHYSILPLCSHRFMIA